MVGNWGDSCRGLGVTLPTLPCNAVSIPIGIPGPRVHAPTPYSEGFIQSDDKWIIPSLSLLPDKGR